MFTTTLPKPHRIVFNVLFIELLKRAKIVKLQKWSYQRAVQHSFFLKNSKMSLFSTWTWSVMPLLCNSCIWIWSVKSFLCSLKSKLKVIVFSKWCIKNCFKVAFLRIIFDDLYLWIQLHLGIVVEKMDLALTLEEICDTLHHHNYCIPNMAVLSNEEY